VAVRILQYYDESLTTSLTTAATTCLFSPYFGNYAWFQNKARIGLNNTVWQNGGILFEKGGWGDQGDVTCLSLFYPHVKDTKILQYHKCFSNSKYPWQGTSAPWPWTWHATDSAKGRPTTSTGLQVGMFICDVISVKRGRRSVQRSKNSTTKNCITKLYHIDKHWSHPSQLCLGPKFALQVCWLNFMLRMIQAWACVTTFSTFLSAWVRLSGTAWRSRVLQKTQQWKSGQSVIKVKWQCKTMITFHL